MNVDKEGFARIPVLSYLTKLMEGEKTEDEYVERVRKAVEEGARVVTLAIHAEEHRYSPETGARSGGEAAANLSKLCRLVKKIKKIKTPGIRIEFATLSEALGRVNTVA